MSSRWLAWALASIALVPGAGARAQDEEAAITTATGWAEVQQDAPNAGCGSLAALLRRLDAERGTVAVRGQASLTYGACRFRSHVSADPAVPATATGSWGRVAAAVRSFLRAVPEARLRRSVVALARARAAELRAERRGRSTLGRADLDVVISFRVDATGTIHVSIERALDQALTTRTSEVRCGPCWEGAEHCRCANTVEEQRETVSGADGAYVQVPPGGAPRIVRIHDAS